MVKIGDKSEKGKKQWNNFDCVISIYLVVGMQVTAFDIEGLFSSYFCRLFFDKVFLKTTTFATEFKVCLFY